MDDYISETVQDRR